MDRENKNRHPKSYLKMAISAAGSQANLAKAIGVTQQAVHGWVKRGYAPLDRCVSISKLYNIEVGSVMGDRDYEAFKRFINANIDQSK